MYPELHKTASDVKINWQILPLSTAPSLQSQISILYHIDIDTSVTINKCPDIALVLTRSIPVQINPLISLYRREFKGWDTGTPEESKVGVVGPSILPWQMKSDSGISPKFRRDLKKT
ncbi:hypothetical protein V3C99_013919 [Haemonchus contortus]